jgi:diguanylate cyclase (GGDEF)-like protein/PAS domain S-box-containing protein
MKDNAMQLPPGLNPTEVDHGFALSLMDHLVVPTFVLDMRCRVLFWNRACEHLTGVPAADVIGTTNHWRGFYCEPRPCLADLVVQGRISETHALYYEYTTSSDPHYGLYAENWCVMPNVGTRLYLAINAGPIYNQAGDLIAVVETLRDMTLQKEAQLALQKLASQDGLTGVANRRSFDDTLETEWRRTMRDSQPLSLLMVDVDRFKNYNDAYGHQAGDECLKILAKTMYDQMQRASDMVARYGGEEFAVILPNIPYSELLAIAERLRAAVENLSLLFPESAFGHVTVSIGGATVFPSSKGRPGELVAYADAALYQAKHAGRNRSVVTELIALEKKSGTA